MLPPKLIKKINTRKALGAFRELSEPSALVDFSSNDYLGFSSNPAFAKAISDSAHLILKEHNILANGATGSRLLSGNHKLYEVAERVISNFHESESALIFNSGYDANIGFFQSVPQRGDLIIYDEFIHASIRDGVQLSLARGYKFEHNSSVALKKLLQRLTEMHHLNDNPSAEIYVVTESVFSMDGDMPDLAAMVAVCANYNAHLIVDEAHAIGVIGNCGQGRVAQLGIQEKVFARIVTFGKAMGCHGAAILGSRDLREYLINFARSFIYTTGLPPHAIATLMATYEAFVHREDVRTYYIPSLRTNIAFFKEQLAILALDSLFIPSNSAIHCAVVSGSEHVRKLAQDVQHNGFNVRPILSPTVPEGKERLRICLHAHNTRVQIKALLSSIKKRLAS